MTRTLKLDRKALIQGSIVLLKFWFRKSCRLAYGIKSAGTDGRPERNSLKNGLDVPKIFIKCFVVKVGVTHMGLGYEDYRFYN